MKSKVFLFSAALLAMSSGALAQQPRSGAYFPEDITDWTPAKDPDAKFNRARIKLQPRFEDNSIKANKNQHYEGKFSGCIMMTRMCGNSPAQGENNMIGYNPTYWQYMDQLTWWGGAKDESCITPPSAPVIDIAHLNGVPVLGNMFFQAGDDHWVDIMLTKKGDAYPYAKAIYDMAVYYGFDGWMINEETNKQFGRASKWAEFSEYFFKCAKEGGHPEMQLQWYDAGESATTLGEGFMKNQGASFFSDYGWQKGSVTSDRSWLESLGIAPGEVFNKVYYGLECARSGLDGNGSRFKTLFPEDKHFGSLAAFSPSEHTWEQEVNKIRNTPEAIGEKAYAAVKQVFENEARWYVNPQNDPSNIEVRSGSIWPGLANAMMERTTIQSLPFFTSFSVGVGKHRFVNGEKRGTQDWNHRGVQNIMPTWRYWIENNATDRLKASLNWDDAYNFGTSLEINGKLTAGQDHLMRLYKVKLAIKSGNKLQLVYKASADNTLELKLGVKENNNAFTTIANPQKTTQNGWTVATYNLDELNGKTVSIIALNLKSAAGVAGYKLQLGQLGVYDEAQTGKEYTVSNVEGSESRMMDEQADIRVTWDVPEDLNCAFFNVYMERNGKKTLVGQTRDGAYYIPKFDRAEGEQSVKVAVCAVNADMKEGKATEITLNFPAPAKPEISIEPQQSLVKVGQQVAVVAQATNKPTKYEWTTPKNAQLVRQSGDTAIFKFNAAGTYDIKVKATNAVGSTEAAIAGLIEVNDTKELENLSKWKKVVAYSSKVDNNNPEYIVDGANNSYQKWWAGGKYEQYAVIDLGATSTVQQFKLFGNGFASYKILGSLDGKNYTEILDRKQPVKTGDYYEAWCKPTNVRYVKLLMYNEDKPFAINVFEFEVMGTERGPVFNLPAKQKVVMKQEAKVVFNYSMNGETEGTDFKAEAKAGDDKMLTVKEVKVDKEKDQVAITLDAKDVAGKTYLAVKLKNGEVENADTMDVYITDPSYVDVFKGKKATAYWLAQNAETNDMTDGDSNTAWSGQLWSKGDITVKIDCDKYYSFQSFDFESSPVPSKIYISEEDNYDNYKLVAQNIPSDATDVDLANPYVGRYVKFVFSLNSYRTVKVSELRGYGKEYEGEIVKKTSVPAKLSGFNQDVIAEATPSKDYSEGDLDNAQFVYYTSDVDKNGGLPSNGKVEKEGVVLYEFAPYDQLNAATIKSVDDVITLSLVTPQTAEGMKILGISTDGNSTLKATANFEDGTKEDFTLSYNDWYGNFGLILSLGRINQNTDQKETSNFQMDEQKVEFATAKKLVSVTFKRSFHKGYPSIFAITLTGVPQGSDSVEKTFVSNNKVVGIYNINGIRLNALQKGLNIVKYANGETRKIVKR